jgi:hypothetical protein
LIPPKVDAGVLPPVNHSVVTLGIEQRSDSLQMTSTSIPAGLKLLEEIVDNPNAKASERLQAARRLKTYLLQLTHLIESRQTGPDVRKSVIEALREYRLKSMS